MIWEYLSITRPYQEDLAPHLITTCDRNAKRVSIDCTSNEDNYNMRCWGNYAIETLHGSTAWAIKEGIRIHNATRVENKYIRKKFRDNIDLIDMEARDYFKSGSITPTTIKYYYGFNHYAMRDKTINYGLLNNECPWYSR